MSEAPVRYREPDFEFRCSMCDHWWPLTIDFWRPVNGMKRCRACWADYYRIKEAARTSDEAIRAVKNFKGRIRWAENKERYQSAQKAWRDRNREHIRAYNAAYRERKKAA